MSDLSIIFFKDLFSYCINRQASKKMNMEELYKTIDRHLYKVTAIVGNNRIGNKERGRLHHCQGKESCPVKTITSYLKGKLDLDLYRRFKFRTTANWINEIQNLFFGIEAGEKALLFGTKSVLREKQILQAADEILKKRKTKAGIHSNI